MKDVIGIYQISNSLPEQEHQNTIFYKHKTPDYLPLAKIPDKKRKKALHGCAEPLMFIDLPAKTWRQQAPPEAPIIHRLDMRSPPFFREPIDTLATPLVHH